MNIIRFSCVFSSSCSFAFSFLSFSYLATQHKSFFLVVVVSLIIFYPSRRTYALMCRRRTKTTGLETTKRKKERSLVENHKRNITKHFVTPQSSILSSSSLSSLFGLFSGRREERTHDAETNATNTNNQVAYFINKTKLTFVKVFSVWELFPCLSPAREIVFM